MWFKELFGFEEESYQNVQENIYVEGESLISKSNGKRYQFGKLEIPTLEQLRKRISLDGFNAKIKIVEIVGNVADFHRDPANNNAVFQAASQFNLLEMVSPNITPEEGVDIYENDRTQGPACAISCGAGTVYRNYFVEVNGKVGQTAENQVNCLENLSVELENEKLNLWKMQNGYAIFLADGLKKVNEQLAKLSHSELEDLGAKLKVGIQCNTQVTAGGDCQLVTQVYCSALPIGYHFAQNKIDFENFAKLLLEASYEATFYAAVQNFQKTGSPKLFLTLVGGGVFGNDVQWILKAISIAVHRFKNIPLEVKIVSYGQSNSTVKEFTELYSL